MEREPSSLQEAIIYFANPANCHDYVVARRWPNGVECPTCGCKEVRFLSNQNRWWCPNEHPKRQFSLKTGTIYEESPLGLDKWLTATWLITNCKNGVSQLRDRAGSEHHAENRRGSWITGFGLRSDGSPDKLTGHVEADETFIGGKARNMHKTNAPARSPGPAAKTKLPSWESWNAARMASRAGAHKGNSQPRRRRRFRRKSASTLRPVPRSTPMR